MSNEDLISCESCGCVMLEEHWSGECEECFYANQDNHEDELYEK